MIHKFFLVTLAGGMNDEFVKALSIISEVVRNRPSPIRHFDQIFMKNRDMVRQARYISRKFRGLDVVFIGDGDAIALSIVHLWQRGILPGGPKRMLVLDFDERIVNSIRRFADRNGYEHLISSRLYNVAEPLPRHLLAKADAFYTNPPWGSSNDGRSVLAFLNRGIESVGSLGVGAVVIADDRSLSWTQQVLHRTQSQLLKRGFILGPISELRHRYQLAEAPDLTSRTLFARRIRPRRRLPASNPLKNSSFVDFYGSGKHLLLGYVRDKDLGHSIAVSA